MSKTRDKVIASAKEVFIIRGFGEARMQEIADHAEINKGLLHYYFKTKENLFHAVVNSVISDIIPKIDLLFSSDMALKDKIRQFVGFYIDLLIANPYLPSFILLELNLRGDRFFKDILNEQNINPMKLIVQLQMEVQKGNIRPMNPFNLMINIISLCVFPFIARPILKEISGLDDNSYLQLMEGRKNEVVEFIFKAIET